MGLYWFFQCGMYCTNITSASLVISYVPILLPLINKMATRCQQYVAYANLGSDVVPGRVSELSEQVHPSSAFVLPMFTMFHPCASIFPHFHQHVAPRELGSCIFFCKKSPGWRATTGAQLPLQDAQLSEGRVDANEQRMGTKM